MGRYLLIPLVTMLLACHNTHGQEHGGNYQQILDSLDKVKPAQLTSVKPTGETYEIKVCNQDQFDRINEEISQAISSGEKNIKVYISGGVYQFHENHIERKDEKIDVSIVIEGKDATITSDNTIEGKDKKPWSDLVFADRLITVVDKEKKVCFIPYNNGFSKKEIKELTRVQITQGYKAPKYDIAKIDKNGIYFKVEDLQYITKNFDYSINADYHYKGQRPRFRLYNRTKETGATASRFLYLENTVYGLFKITGIQFNGNNPGTSLIYLKKVHPQQIIFEKCHFKNIQDRILYANKVDNVVFDQNSIENTAGNELSFKNGCENVRVTNNTFERCGLSIGNTFCVSCGEAEYYIANNIFSDFGYSAIGVGVWHGHEKRKLSKGIIEHNEIYYSQEYIANKEKYTLMDGGAIYTWTQNDGVIIRYNYIHDYTGMGSNRGIFCDDGASNQDIYGNVIINIANSYSIDSRKVKEQKLNLRNNANNRVIGNFVTQPIRFVGYGDGNRHCIKGKNYMLQKDDSPPVINSYDNLEKSEEDVFINDFSYYKGMLRMARQYMILVNKAGVKK